MRSRTLASVLPALVASIALGALGGCAAPAEEKSDEGSQDVTGGSSTIESPVAFLFEGTAITADTAPKCAGAMLTDTMVVTAKACAKEGLMVGRAVDKDGRGLRAKVKTIHVPDAKDADIVVAELDKPLVGTNAVITHMPLRAGYAVNAFAATDGKGFLTPFGADKNAASTVQGTMIEENETHGSITPAKGTEICEGDIGAPVCSTTSFKVPIAGYNVYGTCGLSGLVVSRAPVVSAKAADPDAKPVAQPLCSGGAWKVAQLGQHRKFLEKLAPKAFQPIIIDKPLLRMLPGYAPEGLWGYKSKGDIKTCTLDAAKLDAVKPGAPSAKVSAKVSFAGMDAKAAAWGRFGIAPKAAPTNMRWLPAQRIGTETGAAFATKFEGIVSSEAAGDYVVAFRASANGGESWTTCDTDGSENGYSADKSLSLSITDATTPTPPAGTNPPGTPPGTPSTPPSTPSNQTPPSDPPPTEGEPVSDTTSSSDGNSDPLPDFKPKKKEEAGADDSGCSVSHAPTPVSSSLPIVGVMLGLVAVLRRRRKA